MSGGPPGDPAGDDRSGGERRRRRRDERRHARRNAAATESPRPVDEPEPASQQTVGPERAPAARGDAAQGDAAHGSHPRGAHSRDDAGPREAGAREAGAREARAATSVVPTGGPGRPRVRPTVVLVAVAALLLVALVVGAVATGMFGSQQTDETAPDGTAPVAAQETVFLALSGGGRDVVVGSLLAVDDSRAVSLLVPGQLLLDVPGAGRSPLVESLALGDSAPGQAVADALEVRVDGTWVLTVEGLAQMVDSLGGVVVDVDREVAVGDVLLPVGDAQQLGGSQAATFASYVAEDEAEQVRLARFDQVLSAVLRRLPSDPAMLASQLTSLGSSSRSTLAPEQLAELLARVAHRADDELLIASVLPITELSTGSETTLFSVDDEAAAEVVDTRLAGALSPGGEDAARVLVLNGVGTPGLGEVARDRLVAAGLRFVPGGNASQFGTEQTAVLVPSSSEQDREWGTAVAQALGLGADSVAVGQDEPTLADVIVVLGADFAALAESGTTSPSP